MYASHPSPYLAGRRASGDRDLGSKCRRGWRGAVTIVTCRGRLGGRSQERIKATRSARSRKLGAQRGARGPENWTRRGGGRRVSGARRHMRGWDVFTHVRLRSHANVRVSGVPVSAATAILPSDDDDQRCCHEEPQHRLATPPHVFFLRPRPLETSEQVARTLRSGPSSGQ